MQDERRFAGSAHGDITDADDARREAAPELEFTPQFPGYGTAPDPRERPQDGQCRDRMTEMRPTPGRCLANRCDGAVSRAAPGFRTGQRPSAQFSGALLVAKQGFYRACEFRRRIDLDRGV